MLSLAAIKLIRLPYAPLLTTSNLPSAGTTDPIVASTAKVPLPYIKTLVYALVEVAE